MHFRTHIEDQVMTHTLPKGTLAPFRPILSKVNPHKAAHRAKLIFSLAPRGMGYGRPPQAAAAD